MNHKQTVSFLSRLPITRPVSNDQERVFLSVLNGQVNTRSQATKGLAIRSTTISDCVAELLAVGLLTEEVSVSVGRGRPSLTLAVKANRLVTVVFQVISQSVHIFIINLSAQIIAHDQLEASPDCDNRMLEKIFLELYQRIIKQLPVEAQLVGIVFSLGGVFDRSTYRWIHTSRWPRMHNLAIGNIFPQEQYNISLSRTLDNELLMHLLQRDESTLLLHWGYGVGFAFGQAADRIVAGGYAFGEIGHWHIPGQQQACHCGQQGCLETTTALWSIGPRVLGNDFRAGDDEDHLANLLATRDLMDDAHIQLALRHITSAASNVCRVFFPRRLIISGPFVKNPRLWQAFCEGFEQQNRFFGQSTHELAVSQVSRDLGIYGAAIPVLEQGLAELLQD